MFSVTPSYVTWFQPVNRRKDSDNTSSKSSQRTDSQQKAMQQNFSDNDHRGLLSSVAGKKIRKLVQWFAYLAPLKNVWVQEYNSHVKYRLGLVTVSLPSVSGDVDPRFFVSVLLRQLLDSLNYHYGLRNYIWKLELQKNRNPHAHITVDQYIPHQHLRKIWCEILDRHSLLDNYTDKFNSMTVRQYIKYRLSSDSENVRKRYTSHVTYIRSIINAYQQGVQNGWKLPNCTDVHSVKNIKNLAGYLCKYLLKDSKGLEGYTGRIWSASHSLSKLKSVQVDTTIYDEPSVCDALSKVCTESFTKMRWDRLTMEPKELFSVWWLPNSSSVLDSIPWIGQFFQHLRSTFQSGSSPPKYVYEMLPQSPVFRLIDAHS